MSHHQMEAPLQFRRNAISIDHTIQEHFGIDTESPGTDFSRIMSISGGHDESSVKQILSRLSVNEETNGLRLTDAQVNAFREVFDLFDSNGGGTIDAEELDLALQSVGIKLNRDDLAGVLETMDRDGNGEIDFEEFLNLMTNTEKFLESFENSDDDCCNLEKEQHRREVMLFDALTQFMKNSALHSMEEIVGYFHSKCKRSQAPHVVGHYAASARLIGLTEKQLQKHMERIRATMADSNSPYAQPIFNLIPSTGKKRVRVSSQAAPPSNVRAKKGKIKLTFHTSVNTKRGSLDIEGKTDTRVKGVKSASDLIPPSDTVNKKPLQPSVKRNGWVSVKTKPLIVHLPTVHLKPRKHSGEKQKGTLSFDDLPAIRKKVGKVTKAYYKQLSMKKAAEAEQHWQSLRTENIPSYVLKKRFRKVFNAYTAN